MCPSFTFGIEGGMWDVIALIPDHCLSIYFISHFIKNTDCQGVHVKLKRHTKPQKLRTDSAGLLN